MISGFSFCTNFCHANKTSRSVSYDSTTEFSIGISEQLFKTMQ